MSKRKIIQVFGNLRDGLIAFDNQGNLWDFYAGGWNQLPALPDDLIDNSLRPAPKTKENPPPPPFRKA